MEYAACTAALRVVARWKLKIFFRAFGAAEKVHVIPSVGAPRAVRLRPDSLHASRHGHDSANSKEGVCSNDKA